MICLKEMRKSNPNMLMSFPKSMDGSWRWVSENEMSLKIFEPKSYGFKELEWLITAKNLCSFFQELTKRFLSTRSPHILKKSYIVIDLRGLCTVRGTGDKNLWDREKKTPKKSLETKKFSSQNKTHQAVFGKLFF